ncbi:MAG: sterol desaturase family protein [Rhodospirillales bacterium]|nr:MAG: sterol desaturase family protein [Rhodospirillales bacterium]
MTDLPGIAATLVSHEAAVRLAAFATVLGLMAVWEAARPRRVRLVTRRVRWTANLGIVALDAMVVRLVFPVAAVGMALIAAEQGWGLFNAVGVPFWAAALLSMVLLDLAIWAQHLVFHKVPWLWRLHRMHHTDLDFDVTTGLRFHPLEIVLSMAIKMAVIVALGAPAAAVVAFEVILNGLALFNHANVRLPAGIDAVLRRVIVTPDMHRVHHSVHRDETDSNYGFNLSVWDRLFGTYRAQPRDGHTGMTIGLDIFRSRRDLTLFRLLVQPFARA